MDAFGISTNIPSMLFNKHCTCVCCVWWSIEGGIPCKDVTLPYALLVGAIMPKKITDTHGSLQQA